MTRTWRTAAHFANMSMLRAEITSFVATAGALVDDIALVELAAGELVANAIEHGNGEFVEVLVNVSTVSAVLAVTNRGSPFKRPDVDLPSMGLDECGRGLAILAAFGCTVTVDRAQRDACTVTATIPFHRDAFAEAGALP